MNKIFSLAFLVFVHRNILCISLPEVGIAICRGKSRIDRRRLRSRGTKIGRAESDFFRRQNATRWYPA